MWLQDDLITFYTYSKNFYIGRKAWPLGIFLYIDSPSRFVSRSCTDSVLNRWQGITWVTDFYWHICVSSGLDELMTHICVTRPRWVNQFLFPVSSLKVVTESPQNFRQFWVTIVHQTEISFRLRSRGEAYMALSRIPEVVTAYTYVILLGGGDNHDQFEVTYGGKILGKNVVGVRDNTEKSIAVNTLRPRQDGRHFPDDIFKCIFLNENI